MANSPQQTHPDSLRYEIKMICHERGRDKFMCLLKLHGACVKTLYPPRRVQSIYLDTPFGRALEENLAGISYRRKIRFRWYGSQSSGVRGTLECKVRENMMGWKHKFQFEELIDVEGNDRLTFMNDLARGCDAQWRPAISDGQEPVQWIAYDREYFTVASGKIRITIDTNLRTCDQRTRFILSSAYPTPQTGVMIVEAKCSFEDCAETKKMLNSFPLFIDKCSKFVIASAPNEGPIVSVF